MIYHDLSKESFFENCNQSWLTLPISQRVTIRGRQTYLVWSTAVYMHKTAASRKWRWRTIEGTKSVGCHISGTHFMYGRVLLDIQKFVQNISGFLSFPQIIQVIKRPILVLEPDGFGGPPFWETSFLGTHGRYRVATEIHETGTCLSPRSPLSQLRTILWTKSAAGRGFQASNRCKMGIMSTITGFNHQEVWLTQRMDSSSKNVGGSNNY